MRGLIKGILNRPVTVLMCIIALVVFFITAMSKITLKLTPDMAMPMMVVITPYPGAGPEEVDELVSDKISNAGQSLSGVKTIQCESSEGMSQVLLEYDFGQNMDKAYNDLRQAIDAVRSELPQDARNYTIYEMDIEAMDDITLSVTGKSDTVDVLGEVNNNIEPELKKISALARVSVSGGDEKYIRIQVIPEYLDQYGLSLTGIANAIGAANFSMPAGTASYGDQAMNLSAEVKYDTIPKLEKVPITTSKGQTIYLSDVAKVTYAVSDKTSTSRYMGRENVSVGLKRKQASSPVTLSRQVKPELERLKEKYPDLNIEIEEDAADEIIATLKGVAKTMVEAVLLAMFIIFIFFGDIKGSLIVGSTMPISIMAAIILMQAAGFSLNVVTMAALIIAIGMMTDNAVVVIEMCFRKHQSGLSFRDAAYEGTCVVVNAVIGSTITTLVVYLPLAMMKGLMAQMFKPLAATIIFSLLASLISAIFLIPICFATYKPVEHRDIITNRILKKLSKKYRRVLRFALKWKKSVFLASVILLVVTVFLSTFLKTALYPEQDEGIIDISIAFRPNLDIDAMDDTVKQIEAFVAQSGVVKNYNSDVQRSGARATVVAHKIRELDTPTQEIVDEWNLALKDISPICEVKVTTDSTSGMSSSGSEKEYDITANDIDYLKEASSKITKMMEETDGVLYATSSFKDSGARANVQIDPVLASAKGFSSKELAGLVYNNMSGAKATDVTIDNKKYEVRVKYPEGYYDTVGDVENMSFVNSKGVSVPLTEMATVTFESAPMSVSRQDGRFVDKIKVTMTSDVKDEVTEILDKKVDEFIEADENLTYQENMEERMEREELTSIGVAILIGIFLVFFVMAVQFESVIVSLLVMMCVPFAGIGSILFMLIMGIKVDMVSSMGVLMLAGIVVNNGIILIDMAMQNQAAGMETTEALVDAGSGRLRPILMTTLTTVIAMVPVALGWAKDAKTMQGMAAVIVGGLTASTILTLVLLPTFYLILDRVRVRSAERRERRKHKLEQKVVEQEIMLREKQRADARVNLVFPMAGAGTRFMGKEYGCPKPLIDIAGEPFFKRAADSLVGHVKYERIIFVVLKEHVEKYEIDKKIRSYYPDAKIVQLPEVLPGAVMTAVEGAKAIHNEYPVIFTDCDLMFTSEDMYEYYRIDDYDAAGTLLTFRSDKDCYSYVETGEWIDAGGNTVEVAEKTAEKEVISDRAITGAYGFINAAVFIRAAEKYMENCPYDEYYMSGIYNQMIQAGRRVRVFDTDTFLSFGTPEELKQAEESLRKQEKEEDKPEDKTEEKKKDKD